jgi:transcriptional regulator GlxA family with amidase domain
VGGLAVVTGREAAAISRFVGHASPFAFSEAFTRSYGVSPVEHRRSGTG